MVALGQLYLVTDDRKGAEQQWALVETIARLNKANGVQGDVQLARFLADRDRRLDESLTIAELEFKRRPNVFVADALAWSYYKNGRYADARRAITKALAQRTPDASIFFHAGMIYAKLGDRPDRPAPPRPSPQPEPSLRPHRRPASGRDAGGTGLSASRTTRRCALA